MNIIEAIKSGKRFKRPMWDKWTSAYPNQMFTIEAIVLTDWIVEEEPKPKRRLCISDDGHLSVGEPSAMWKQLTEAEFEALFD